MQEEPQYDFIMNPGGGPPVRRPVMGGGSSSMIKRLILVGVGAMVLIIIAGLAMQLLFNNKPDNAQQLLEIAQQQNELIRVSQIGVDKAHGSDAKNLAITTKLSLSTDQQPLIDALAKQNVKAKKQLGGGKNTKTDDALNVAEQNNRFDDALVQYLRTELVSYQKKLDAAYRNTTSRSLKEAIKHQYQNASTLAGVKAEE